VVTVAELLFEFGEELVPARRGGHQCSLQGKSVVGQVAVGQPREENALDGGSPPALLRQRLRGGHGARVRAIPGRARSVIGVAHLCPSVLLRTTSMEVMPMEAMLLFD
jgi:hypothetical protein